jgi:hypothetical protein
VNNNQLSNLGRDSVAINYRERFTDCDLQDVVLWAERMIREKETVIVVNEIVRAWPYDGALAMYKAAKKVFGWTEARDGVRQTMFGPMPVPPQEVSVETGYGVYVKVPWGGMAVPGVEGELQCGATMHEGMPAFVLSGKIKKKSLPLINELMVETRRIVAEESIYRGKALIIDAVQDEDTGAMTVLKQPPKFFRTSGLTKADLVLPEHTYRAVNMAVFSMIENVDQIRAAGLPTKRTTVLDGQPGTGKTLTMSIAAGLCEKHGRTFILLRDIDFLEDAIMMADRYNFGPTLISAEDIDRRMFERSESANKLLNAIDGVDSKKLDIQFLLTTNYREKLIETFQRAGRSDMIITLPVPDQMAASELLRRYSVDNFTVSPEQYLEIGKILADAQTLPSNIAETVQRARLYCIAEGTDHVDGQMLKDVALQVVEEKKPQYTEPPKREGIVEEILSKMETVKERLNA